MHRVAWKNLTKESLNFIMDPINDPYKNFPFLELKETNIYPKKYFISGGVNYARGEHSVGADDQKLLSLEQLLKPGWSVVSWPIPILESSTSSCDQLKFFDRRHTFNVCGKIPEATHLPGAIYTRKYDSNKGWLNDLDDDCISIIASIWGNIYSGQAADTKAQHFVTGCEKIFKVSEIHPTKDLVMDLLNAMGVKSRYGTNLVTISQITKILDSFNAIDLTGKTSYCTGKEDLNQYLKESNYYHENSNTYDLISQTKTIDSNFSDTYAYRIIQTAIEAHNNKKSYRVLCASNSSQVKKISKDRAYLKESLHYIWDSFSNIILEDVYKLIRPEAVSVKSLADLEMDGKRVNSLVNLRRMEDLFEYL